MSKNAITAIAIVVVVIILLVLFRFTKFGAKEESTNTNNAPQTQNTNSNTNTTNSNTNSSTSSDFPNEFASKKFGLSIRYPNGYTPNENYTYQMDPSKNIQGISLTVPQAAVTGTNLSNDSYISLETLSNISPNNCTAERFAGQSASGVHTISENGRIYSFVKTTGAAAGNQYEEDIYAFTTNNNCFAFRYFLHTTSVTNYPDGTVKEYNRDAFITTFDKIRRDFVSIHP